MSKEDSKEEEAAASVEEEVCANCGIAAAGDDIKLKSCACKLVKYCTVNCQKNHRPQHKKMCKMGLAKLRDDDLFKMPDDTHLGECPLCCLPLPLDLKLNTLTSCCSKNICNGCSHANHMREKEGGLEHRCPFCRELAPGTDEEIDKNVLKRIKAGDPVAMRRKGFDARMAGNYSVALEYLMKAAKMGDAEAHMQLGYMYDSLSSCPYLDMKKAMHHYEEAAIGGHPGARNNLAAIENNIYFREERAVKHFIIAASLGCDMSLATLQNLYKHGRVKKEDLAAAYRAHHAAVEATKSSQREEAKGADTVVNGI